MSRLYIAHKGEAEINSDTSEPFDEGQKSDGNEGNQESDGEKDMPDPIQRAKTGLLEDNCTQDVQWASGLVMAAKSTDQVGMGRALEHAGSVQMRQYRQEGMHLKTVSLLWLCPCSLSYLDDNVSTHALPAAMADAIATASISNEADKDAPVETIGNSSLLLWDAQVSSLRWKCKIQNMAAVSVCMCGELAAPTASSVNNDLVCCWIARCETKQVSHNNSFQGF